MNLLLKWLLASLALLITIHLRLPGLRPAGSAFMLLAATLALGLLNLAARPLLLALRVVTMPLSCVTLGLWSLGLAVFANTLLFYFVGTLGWGFKVTGFWGALLGALVMSALTTVLTAPFGTGRQRKA